MGIFEWWNLIFLLPALAAVLYLVLVATGTVAGDAGEVDADLDADVDAGDLHGIEHAVAEAGQASNSDGGPGGLLHVLSLVGIGRAPLSLLLISFFLLWGFLGWVGNGIFGSFLSSPGIFIWPSLLLALVGAAVLTRLLANGLHRVLPSTETYAVSNRQLVGKLASVRYAVSETAGTAQLHDDQGRLHEVPARVLPGEAAIPAQTDVVLWRYDADANAYLVIPEHDSSEVDAPRRRHQMQEEAKRS